MTLRDHRLLKQWTDAWPTALDAWSSFTKLRPPTFCLTRAEEALEGLLSSFAMIRLRDHAVVISLRQVAEAKLDDFAVEILAHEIGHHVFVPADLRDNARLLARIRAALDPQTKHYGPLIANLWADLLINDRLQRAGFDIAGIYEVIQRQENQNATPVWTLYMRTYEHLWSLPRGHLAARSHIAAIDGDAILTARLVRSFAREWVDGAGKFAALLYPHLVEETKENMRSSFSRPWLDGLLAGESTEMPDGLATMEDGELTGIGHPALDNEIFGEDPVTEFDGGGIEDQVPGVSSRGRASVGGEKNRYRPPTEFRELMASLGVNVPLEELICRYYRELARPHLIRFPTRELPAATEPVLAGVEVWEPGYPIAAIDWMATAIRSPVIIPGVTTVQRLHDESPGSEPEREAPDLYLGVDCSGSMGNPAVKLSYPVLAGAVITLSALRAGARVMTCLSGEPGEHSETEGFSRDATANLRILTGYLGTGYAFGLQRLVDQFLLKDPPRRPVHLLIVTDYDLMSMLAEYFTLRGDPDPANSVSGWFVAEEALKRAGGGGTVVIQGRPSQHYNENVERLRSIGWSVYFVENEEELVRFARAFSRTRYANERS